ncbi:MAG: FAD-dependent oxidoreductase [Nitrospinae bacterium]|nr:FAD-dependent oxidoreductase [Nitrospinota bacterium]
MRRRTFLQIMAAASLAGPGCSGGAPSSVGGTPPPSVDGGEYDLVVIGGGIAGLTAAWRNRGGDVLLLEKETTAGGRTIAGSWNGYRYPKGTEYLGLPEGKTAELLNQLGLWPTQVAAPTIAAVNGSSLYYGFAGAKRMFEEAGALASYQKIEAAFHRLLTRELQEEDLDIPAFDANLSPYDDMTVAQWLDRQGAHPLVKQFIDVENRGLFGASNSDLSMLYDIPEMGWNLVDFEGSPAEGESGSYSFPGGMVEVIEALMTAVNAQ